MTTKTSIHILPSMEKDKEDYLIFYLDEEAHVKFQDGKDAENTQVIAFFPRNQGDKSIAKIIIELVDGKPIFVQTVAE